MSSPPTITHVCLPPLVTMRGGPRQQRMWLLFLLLSLIFHATHARPHDVLRRRPPLPSLWLYRNGGEANITSSPEIHGEHTVAVPPPSSTASTSPLLPSVSHSKPSRRSKRLVFRDAVFPIYGREVRKFFSMGMIKFLIVFVLTITRDVKDTLIVTSCGAESIAFLKVYGVLPAAAAFTIAYSKMSNSLSKDALYYALVAPFFIFYLLFDLIIYPRRHQLHPAATATSFQGLSYLLGLYNNWTFALYYIVSEIYSSVSIGLLFWQFANDVITVDEAKRFYPLFGQLSSIAPIIAGQCVARVASNGDFGASLRVLTILTSLCGVGIMILYRYCSLLVDKEARDGLLDSSMVQNLQQRRPRPQLSLQESSAFLLNSQYLRYMAVLVLGFGLAINFTDILWKSMVKDYFPDKLAYQRFMGYYSSTVGATTFVVIFFGSNIVKHLGWRIGALATPVMMALLAIPFFGAIFLKGFGASTKKTALLAVGAGALMSVLSKATKYALFDPTTQMAYIPLDEESKSKGKAAIDVLGSRVGKSLGALLLQACVVVFGSAIRASYVVGGMFYVVIFSWVYSANNLATMFEALTERSPRSSSSSSSSSSTSSSDNSSGDFPSPLFPAMPRFAPVAAVQEGEMPAEVPPSSSSVPPSFLAGGLNPHIAPPPVSRGGEEEDSDDEVREGLSSIGYEGNAAAASFVALDESNAAAAGAATAKEEEELLLSQPAASESVAPTHTPPPTTFDSTEEASVSSHPPPPLPPPTPF